MKPVLGLHDILGDHNQQIATAEQYFPQSKDRSEKTSQEDIKALEESEQFGPVFFVKGTTNSNEKVEDLTTPRPEETTPHQFGGVSLVKGGPDEKGTSLCPAIKEHQDEVVTAMMKFEDVSSVSNHEMKCQGLTCDGRFGYQLSCQTTTLFCRDLMIENQMKFALLVMEQCISLRCEGFFLSASFSSIQVVAIDRPFSFVDAKALPVQEHKRNSSQSQSVAGCLAVTSSSLDQGTDPVLLNNADYQEANEIKLIDCPSDTVTSWEDAGVRSHVQTIQDCVKGDPKLVGAGGTVCEGHVEMCYNEVLGILTSDSVEEVWHTTGSHEEYMSTIKSTDEQDLLLDNKHTVKIKRTSVDEQDVLCDIKVSTPLKDTPRPSEGTPSPLNTNNLQSESQQGYTRSSVLWTYKISSIKKLPTSTLSACVGFMLPCYCQGSPYSNPLPSQTNGIAIVTACFIILVICVGFLVFKRTRNRMRFFERLNERPPHPNERSNEIPPHPNETPPHPNETPPHPNELPPHPNETPPHPNELPPHPNKIPPHPNKIPHLNETPADTQTSTGVRKRNHWDGGSQQVSEDTHRSHFPKSSEFVVHHSHLPSKETGTLGQSDCHPFLEKAVWDLQLLDFEKSYTTSPSSPPDQSSEKQSMRDQLQLFSCEYEDKQITGSPISAKQCNPPTSCYNRNNHPNHHEWFSMDQEPVPETG